VTCALAKGTRKQEGGHGGSKSKSQESSRPKETFLHKLVSKLGYVIIHCCIKIG
jgi:hypothetical protein